MTENISTLPKFESSDRCLSPADLFVSKKFETFLALYNRKNKTDISVKDIVCDYSLALEVWNFARNSNVAGGSPMRVATDISSLVGEILAEVKIRDTGRVLPENELLDRFEELGVDVEKIRKTTESFNAAAGYGEALKVAGVLGKKEEYSLPMPALTEAEMKILEEAFNSHQAGQIHIDDARLTDTETYVLMSGTANKKNAQKTCEHIENSLPLCNRQFENLERVAGDDWEEDKLKEYFAAAGKECDQPERKVRLLAYYYNPTARSLEPMAQQSGQSLTCAFPKLADGRVPISLGTYIRLSRYAAENDPGFWGKFNICYIRDGHSAAETYPGETLLNNVDPMGNAILIKRDDGKKQLGIKWVNAAENVPLRTVKRGIYL